jgi:NADH-quinone oxidoreductase subunit J
LNQRPPGYEPDELPGCSTPQTPPIIAEIPRLSKEFIKHYNSSTLITADLIFWVLAVICVGAVTAMILSRNQGHNALLLVLAFSALGGIFGLLDAPFAAVIQILVYAGAIMVLFLFVLMMIDPREAIAPERRRRAKYLGGAMGLILLAELGFALRGLFGSGFTLDGGSAGPAAVGRSLFTTYLYPFDITSVLILAALIGAVVLGKKENPDS